METDSNADEIDDDTRDVVLTDQLRVMIVGVLTQAGPLSAADLASELGISADRVRTNLRRLLAAGVVALAAEEPRRGVVQRYYASDGQIVIKDASRLDLKQQRALVSGILRLSFKEAANAFLTGPLKRLDSVLVHVPLVVDEAGWKELVAIHEEALVKVQALRDKLNENVRPGDDGTFRAISVMTCFEEPPRQDRGGGTEQSVG